MRSRTPTRAAPEVSPPATHARAGGRHDKRNQRGKRGPLARLMRRIGGLLAGVGRGILRVLRKLAHLWWLLFVFVFLNWVAGLIIALLQGGLPALLVALTSWGFLQPAEQANPRAFFAASGALALLAVVGLFVDLDEKRTQRQAPTTTTGRATLVLARDLDPVALRMGDRAAATFPYLADVIQRAYDQTLRALGAARAGRGEKSGVLLVGAANAGKTRLAFEAITATLPDWNVLRWNESFEVKDLPDAASLRARNVVFFVDDLQAYAPGSAKGEGTLALANRGSALREALAIARQALQGSGRRLVVVATCRAEDRKAVEGALGWLFEELEVVDLPRFSPDETQPDAARVIGEFTRAGATHTDEWNGTIGSLVLGLSRVREKYLRLVGAGDPAATVLRAMKLLTLAETTRHSERRLRAVCAEVFGEWALRDEERVWRAAVSTLATQEFVSESVSGGETVLAIVKDDYVPLVVTDYPDPARPAQLTQDFAALLGTLDSLKDADGLFNLGNAYYDRKGYDEALAALDRALSLDPTDAMAWSNKGTALYNLGRSAEALAAYDRALALDPTDAEVWYNKGLALDDLGRSAEALVAYDRALALAPNNAAAWYNKGTVLDDLGRFEEALAAYDRALSLDPTDAAAWYNKGLALNDLKRYEEALACAERALVLGENAIRWRTKAMALRGLGRTAEALVAYDRALALDPNYAAAWNNKGNALYHLGRFEEALVAYDRALSLDPTDADVWYNKGNALNHLGRFEEALACAERALALSENAIRWRTKAGALRGLGRTAEAEEAGRRALALGG